jgi:hypothetical protein
MAGERDAIHQIEYRWQHEKDLSPFATTMPEARTAGWNDLIRPWVRHPQAAGLSESVCYKVWTDTGDAALAWRYRDPRAAERAEGASGRPHVSRVLVGHASLLTPAVAIAVAWMGLPPSARPDLVTATEQLPIIRPDEVAGLVTKLAADLDWRAAQHEGLLELTAVALSDRDRPLAVYLPEDQFAGQLKKSPQGALLWGLYRAVSQLPGTGRRGWSFSTFELPLGAQDAATLPDIVFRQDVRAGPPPGIVRSEVKAWPFDSDGLTGLSPHDIDRAERLVDAYVVRGIEGVQRLIAEDATLAEPAPPAPGPEPEPAVPIELIGQLVPEDSLIANPAADTGSAPEPMPADGLYPDGLGPDAPPSDLVSPDLMSAGLMASDLMAPDRPRGPQDREDWFGSAALRDRPAAPTSPPQQAAGRHHRPGDRLGSSREGQPVPPLPLPGGTPVDDLLPPRDQVGRASSWPSGHIDALLKKMQDTADAAVVREILQFIVSSRVGVGESESDEARTERQQARRVLSHPGWYDSVTRNTGSKLTARELARLFQIVVIPDLGKADDVAERIGGWADTADPEMVCGLLMAARDTGGKERTGLRSRKSRKDHPGEQVRQIMLPRLARRWASEQGIAQWWDDAEVP